MRRTDIHFSHHKHLQTRYWAKIGSRKDFLGFQFFFRIWEEFSCFALFGFFPILWKIAHTHTYTHTQECCNLILQLPNENTLKEKGFT
jgi:hypothetical protein